MEIIILLLVSYNILFHFYAFILEAFLWTTPFAMRSFGLTKEFAEKSKLLAINQGVYNLFIVAGLIWSLLATNPSRTAIQLFFFGCIAIAGITGGLTISKRILVTQCLPALIAFLLLLLLR